MSIIVFLLFINSFVYANVDYWGTSLIKQETKKVKQKQKVDLVKESIKWYEEKIKKEKPPIEYYYFLNPEKYANDYIKWIQWKQSKINDLTRFVFRHARVNYVSVKDIITYLKQRGYILFYFYRPDCLYCEAQKPEIKHLQIEGLKVIWINIYKKPYFALKWRIDITPTMILVSKKEKKAFRIAGFMPSIELIHKFYKMVKEND